MNSLTQAISVPKSILDEMEVLARDMKMSSTDLCELALREFLEYRRKNREILEKLNSAYDDFPDPAEQELVEKMKKRHKQLLEGQW